MASAAAGFAAALAFNPSMRLLTVEFASLFKSSLKAAYVRGELRTDKSLLRRDRAISTSCSSFLTSLVILRLAWSRGWLAPWSWIDCRRLIHLVESSKIRSTAVWVVRFVPDAFDLLTELG